MSLTKRIGLGAVIAVSSSSGGTFTEIGGLMSIGGPDGSGDDIDTSTIDNVTKFKTFLRGQVDPGELALGVAMGTTDVGQKEIGTAYADGVIRFWKIWPGSTADETPVIIEGYVKSIGRAIEKDAMITQTFGVKISDDPLYPSTS